MTEPLTSTNPDRLARLFDAYRHTASSQTALALVAANAVPLVGVLFFDWSLWTILAIYWAENGIVGLWNIPKILLARGVLLPGRTGVGYRSWAVQPMSPLGRGILVVFFAFHYGMFWLVHGVFVTVLPSFLGLGAGLGGVLGGVLGGRPDLDPGAGSGTGAFGVLDWSAVAAAALVLFLSHGLSFFVDYLGKGEYLTQTAAFQLFAPYGRVIALQVTILFGGFAIAFLGAPILLLVILVVAKTLLDLRLQLRQSRMVGPLTVPTA